ncbi:unnamed protein product [Linum trigynum]|uniref:Uncharacterized protein n=1 Tax=Linum trigynum TaxID=586398 RepID=A0AAV2E2M4_9ROSI
MLAADNKNSYVFGRAGHRMGMGHMSLVPGLSQLNQSIGAGIIVIWTSFGPSLGPQLRNKRAELESGPKFGRNQTLIPVYGPTPEQVEPHLQTPIGLFWGCLVESLLYGVCLKEKEEG